MAQSTKKARKKDPAIEAEKIKEGDSDAVKGQKRRARFLRLGALRVSKAIKSIRLIGNLSGSGYNYTEDDIKKIDSAIDTELKAVFKRFQPKTASGGKAAEFKFE